MWGTDKREHQTFKNELSIQIIRDFVQPPQMFYEHIYNSISIYVAVYKLNSPAI